MNTFRISVCASLFGSFAWVQGIPTVHAAQIETTALCRPKRMAVAGFREIPLGSHTFRVVLQADGGSFKFTSFQGGDGRAIWVPGPNRPGSSIHTYQTSVPLTQYQFGGGQGLAVFEGVESDPGKVSVVKVPNTRYESDVEGYPVGYPNPSRFDPVLPYFPLFVSSTLPQTYQAGAGPRRLLRDFVIQQFTPGYIWFTSDNPSVAVYRFDRSIERWTKADKPFLVESQTERNPGGPYRISRTSRGEEGKEYSEALIQVHYRSVVSTNPEDDGDSIDIIQAGLPGLPNPTVAAP
jgi:hypothetical protein